MLCESVIALLCRHEASKLDHHEAAMVAATLQFVQSQPDCLERTCAPGHLTGSAWVVSPDRSKVLLTHHRKLDKWLQLGGHADGDPDLWSVARREALEESGLRGLRAVTPFVFDVDRHAIPEHAGVPKHFHYDLRFLFEADPTERLSVTSESKELAWVPLKDVQRLNPEESMLRMVRKTR